MLIAGLTFPGDDVPKGRVEDDGRHGDPKAGVVPVDLVTRVVVALQKVHGDEEGVERDE